MLEDPLSVENRETFLGFDYGTKKIGVAVGQSITGTTSPLETIYAIKQKTDWERITRLNEIWRPNGFVLGISYQEDGTENTVTGRMLRFGRQLEGRYRIPVYMIDEALTTMEAKRSLAQEVKIKTKKITQVHDQVAAQLILQSWFAENVGL